MAIELIALGMFGLLIVLLLAGVPLAFVGGGVAAIFILALWGIDGFFLVFSHVWDTMTSYTLVAVPMFVFMANMLERSGIGDSLFKAIHVWSGGLRGSLAVVTVLTCMVIAAMVGIIGAGVVMMGLIALPAMLKRGYSKSMALGCIVAGGGLGQLIPPSVMFIVYALMAGVSVGKLFLAGLAAGVILGGAYIIYILIRCYFQPHLAPLEPKEERMIPLAQKLVLLKDLIVPGILMAAVLGSIFLGVATPTEAAGVGALGSMASAAIYRHLNWKNLKHVLFRTVRATCMIAWIFFGVTVFSAVFTLAGAGKMVENIIVGLPLSPMGIIIVMQVFYLIMGVPMDWLGCLMITAPIFLPIVEELGFCLVWFGVLFNVNMQIAYLSPPVGAGMFYLKGVAPPGVTMGDIFRSVLPYLGCQLIVLVLIMALPQIVMWLPNLVL